MPWNGLKSVIVAFPGSTYSLSNLGLTLHLRTYFAFEGSNDSEKTAQ